MSATEERTGYVRVLLKGGQRMGGRQTIDVKADSFGEAASKIDCLPQQIIEFQWISKGTFDSDSRLRSGLDGQSLTYTEDARD
jgi:hypothetical protein